MDSNKEIKLEKVFDIMLKKYNINTDPILMSIYFVDIYGYERVIDDAHKCMKQYPRYRKVIKQQMDMAIDRRNFQSELFPNLVFAEYCKLVLLMRNIRVINRKRHKR